VEFHHRAGFEWAPLPKQTGTMVFIIVSPMRILSHFVTVIGGLSLLPTVLVLGFGFPGGSQKALTQKPLISTLRGVNLGGWLVLEVRQTTPYLLV